MSTDVFKMGDEESENLNFRQWWRKRSKLEQRLIGSLTLVSLILIIIVLSIIIKHTTSTRTCKTSTCLTEASQILAHIDPSIDPCDNFFKFACGKFVKNTHGDIKASSILRQKEQIDRQMAEMIREPIKASDPYWYKKEKRFFQSCMNETENDQNQALNMVKKVLLELNEWPVVAGNNWRRQFFDWKEMVYTLRKNGYPYKSMLSIDVFPDLGETNRHVIGISTPYIEIIKDDDMELYKKFMIDICAYFGADRVRAESDMAKVLIFIQKLQKVADKYYWTNVTENNPEMIRNSTRFTVKEFQGRNGDIDWLEFINNIIEPVAKINLDEFVIFPRQEFLDGFFDLIHKTDKRVISNYIIWRFVEESVSYLPKELRQLRKNYTCLANSLVKDTDDRFEFCKREFSRSFQPEPLRIMYAREYLPKNSRKKVKELVKSIKDEFVEMLHANSWMDDETKGKVLEKVKSTVEVIGAPGDYYDDAVMEPYPRKEGDFQKEDQNASFFELVRNSNRRNFDAEYFEIHMTIKDTKLDQYYRLIPYVDAMYGMEDNVIILPVGILQGVFYNPDRPMYLNYAAIGSIVGHELTHGFSKAGNMYGKDGREMKLWSDHTEKAYEEKIKCLVQEADEFVIEESDEKINGSVTLEENIADYTGLKVAYAAYRKWVDENGEESGLIGLKYTPNQLFWIASTSYECFDNLDVSQKVEPHAHNEFRVIGSTRNHPEFANDFNCAAGSKMNPLKKCQIF